MSACPRCHTPLPVDHPFCSLCPPDYTHELRERLAQALEGRYQIIRLLGRGGMAAVFLAHDLALERQVAIKVLPPDTARDGQLITRFQREAKTAAKLDHPSIIPIHRVESEAGLVYIVMKFVSGNSLEDLLLRGPLPIPRVRQILRDAALALGHAHRRQIVHRDVKPANIMLDEEGRVVLTDFGISKALEGTTQLTGTGTIIGTPAYMSPEQAKGREVDGRADQYALAIVGYRALTGKLPFEGDSHSILYQQVFELPLSVLEQRPDTPHDLRLALERALAKDPRARYPSTEEFAAAVSGERAASAGSASTTLVRPPTTESPRARSGEAHGSGVLVALATLAVVIVLVSIGVPRLQSTAERPATERSVVSAAPKIRAPVKKSGPAKLRAVDYTFISVRSNPRALLYVDGAKVGLTPITNHRLTAGTHRLRLEQKGYQPVAETIVIKSSRPVNRRYELRRYSGR